MLLSVVGFLAEHDFVLIGFKIENERDGVVEAQPEQRPVANVGPTASFRLVAFSSARSTLSLLLNAHRTPIPLAAFRKSHEPQSQAHICLLLQTKRQNSVGPLPNAVNCVKALHVPAHLSAR